MITEAKIKSLLKEHLLRKEWEECSHRLDDIFDLVFKDGRNIIGIKILGIYTDSHARLREEIENAMLETLKAGSGKVDKIYIAVPANTRLAVLPPANKFKKAGIGLLLVKEDGGVEERIIARPLRSETLDLKQLEELSSLITSLKAKVYAIEERIKEIQSLKQKLSLLESKISRIDERISAIRPRTLTVPDTSAYIKENVTEKEIARISTDLPEFARDNPWLTVLSRRGSEDKP